MKYTGNRNYRDYELISEETAKKEKPEKKSNVFKKILNFLKK